MASVPVAACRTGQRGPGALGRGVPHRGELAGELLAAVAPDLSMGSLDGRPGLRAGERASAASGHSLEVTRAAAVPAEGGEGRRGRDADAWDIGARGPDGSDQGRAVAVRDLAGQHGGRRLDTGATADDLKDRVRFSRGDARDSGGEGRVK